VKRSKECTIQPSAWREAAVPNRHLWIHEELQLVVQSPASNHPPHSSVERVVVSTGDAVSVWSLTDLVIDRLAQVVWHNAYERLVQALALLDAAGERFDLERARQRAQVATLVAAAVQAPRALPRDGASWDALAALGERPERLGPREDRR
jgi:predicted nucleic acid-binding protein